MENDYIHYILMLDKSHNYESCEIKSNYFLDIKYLFHFYICITLHLMPAKSDYKSDSFPRKG